MSHRAVVFDLDGVLIDSEPLWAAAIRDLLRAHGRDYRADVAARHLGMRLPDVAAILREGHDLAVEADLLGDQLVAGLLARFEEELSPMAGAAEAMAMARSRGYPVGLATSSPAELVRYVLDRFAWRFDVVCSGDEVRHGKPAPEIYLLAAQRLFLPPTRCLAVEDSPHGARAAKAAGFFCITVGRDARGEGDLDLDSLAALTAEKLPR